MRSRLLLLVAALVLLSGCEADVTGDATPEEKNTEPLLPDEAFGDLTTIDPCGYLEPAAFADYGQVDDAPVPDFDECTYLVTVSEAQVIVRVGMLTAREDLPEGTEEMRALPQESTLLELPRDDNGCYRAVALRTGHTVSVRANSSGGADKGQPLMCELAESGAAAVFETMRGGKVAHWRPKANSLAELSACELLEEDQVTTQLGIGPGKVTQSQSEHQCRWGRTGGDTATAVLRFRAGDRAALVQPDATAEPIAGRTTWMKSVSSTNAEVCYATTEHVESTLAGDGTHEYAELSVLVPPAAGKNPCTVVRELAAAAWPKLPALT